MYEKDFWHQGYQNAIDQFVFNTEPSYNEFCAAVLRRCRWYFKSRLVPPLEWAMPDIYTTALMDLAH